MIIGMEVPWVLENISFHRPTLRTSMSGSWENSPKQRKIIGSRHPLQCPPAELLIERDTPKTTNQVDTNQRSKPHLCQRCGLGAGCLQDAVVCCGMLWLGWLQNDDQRLQHLSSVRLTPWQIQKLQSSPVADHREGDVLGRRNQLLHVFFPCYGHQKHAAVASTSCAAAAVRSEISPGRGQ